MCDELNQPMNQSTDKLVDFYQKPLSKQFEQIDDILMSVWPEYAEAFVEERAP